jgi:hypothetical protein
MASLGEQRNWRLLVGDKVIECDLIWQPRKYGPRRYYTMRYHRVGATEEHLIIFTDYEWDVADRYVRVYGASTTEN